MFGLECRKEISLQNVLRPRKKLFVSCNSLRKNRVIRSVGHYFLGQKFMFYACFTLFGSWEGRKNFRVGIFYGIKTC